MSDISTLTTLEKSRLLAEAVGWSLWSPRHGLEMIHTGRHCITISDGRDLYHPSRMQFAWAILNHLVTTNPADQGIYLHEWLRSPYSTPTPSRRLLLRGQAPWLSRNPQGFKVE